MLPRLPCCSTPTENADLARWQGPAALLLGIVCCAAVARAQEPTPPWHVTVVRAGLGGAPEHQRFRAIAEQVAAFHHARAIDFDGTDWAGLRTTLSGAVFDALIVVVPPELLDLDLHAGFLDCVTKGPFTMATLGYLTARNGVALEKLWQRTVAMHRGGLKSRTWIDTAVTSSGKSFVYDGGIPAIAKAAGFTGRAYYFSEIGHDPGVVAFVAKSLPALQEAGVIALSGNGDPQGIWLFSGERNRDASKHWPYDPRKVGQDPRGEMPRITAEQFRALKLGGPIVWSGTCHSGATHRVFVESDIVSTFGRVPSRAGVEPRTIFALPLAQSLALAFIDAGATAMLLPLGPNHGMSAMREQEFALRDGATLGEAMKSTYDDALQQVTVPAAPANAGGESKPTRPRALPIMAQGAMNRAVFGDPTLRPFARTAHPTEDVRVTRATDGLMVEVRWQKGFHAGGWDMYGTDRQRDWRVYARVPLDAPPATVPTPGDTTVTGTTEDGQPLDYRLTHVVTETFAGRSWLHLQANVERKVASEAGVTVTFHVRWR